MAIRPLGDAEKVELAFQIAVSPEFIEETIDTQAIKPPTEWEVSFDLEDLSAPLRQRLRIAHERYLAVEPFPEFPRPIDDAEEFLGFLEPWLDAVEVQEIEAQEAEEKASRAQQRANRRFRSEMEKWAVNYGSKRLRAAIDGNYRANTTYAVERGNTELPGFWIDTAGDGEWGERSDPSEEALLLEQGVDADFAERGIDLEHRIVWLEESPRALDRKLENEDLMFEPEEAILVAGYLGRYTAVMPLDLQCRNITHQEAV